MTGHDPQQADAAALLEVTDLAKAFGQGGGADDATVHAVAGVSFAVREGETFGLVGESGSGKSTLARCILRLVEPTAGSVRFRGQDLVGLSSKEMRRMRRHLQIVFQDPYASLDPRMTAERIVEEPLTIHGFGDAEERRRRAHELIELVGLSSLHHRRRPHQLSGGQCQRLAIARALVIEPSFVALDEPVTSLDVSVQAQVLNLLREVQARLGLTYIFITHDLIVSEYFCDRIAVMYRGRIVELASREGVFRNPLHPYTSVLSAAVPRPEPQAGKVRRQARVAMGADTEAAGCPFRARCPIGHDRELCRAEAPRLEEKAAGRWAACHFPDEAAAIQAPDTRKDQPAPHHGYAHRS